VGASWGFPAARLPHPLTDPLQSDILAMRSLLGDRMHFHQWKRREFITLLGGAAAAWPLAARAQQGERMRRVGILITLSERDPEAQARLTAFREGLRKLGWTEGRNLRIEYRLSAGDAERGRAYAADLVAMTPDVILNPPRAC
jgi:hypothetical protein